MLEQAATAARTSRIAGRRICGLPLSPKRIAVAETVAQVIANDPSKAKTDRAKKPRAAPSPKLRNRESKEELAASFSHSDSSTSRTDSKRLVRPGRLARQADDAYQAGPNPPAVGVVTITASPASRTVWSQAFNT